MSSTKITKRMIDSIAPNDIVQVVFDSEISGFGLKVATSGRKTFFLKYRTPEGRQRKPTIGRYGDITLDQARRIAQKWKAQIILGEDPAPGNKSSSPTLNEFVEGYFANASKKQSTLKMERNNYDLHVALTLGKMQVDKITKGNVQEWFRKLSKTPSGANRTISLLSAIFNEAERHQIRPEQSNPCKLIKRYSETARVRYLSRAELSRLTSVLDKAEREESFHPSVVPAIRLALLTGARKTEVLSLKWDWVDFDEKYVALPDSKTGARKVFLSDEAVELLRSIKRFGNNPYVFWGARPNDHYHNLRKPFSRILELAGIEGFRIHDLRHTHAAYAVMAGVPLNVIAKTLGHNQVRTTERYAHVDDAPALEAVRLTSMQMA